MAELWIQSQDEFPDNRPGLLLHSVRSGTGKDSRRHTRRHSPNSALAGGDFRHRLLAELPFLRFRLGEVPWRELALSG
jgi:hypothetical protein